MLAKVINGQSFCKDICKHVGIIELFDHEFAINDKLSNIIVLDIDVFGLGLTLGILSENDISLIVSM